MIKSRFSLGRILVRALVPLWALGAGGELAAHTISVSQGLLTLEGNRGHYEMRMPLFEMGHISQPEIDLFRQLHFYSRGVEARVSSESCRNDLASDAYLCTAQVDFAGDADEITIACKFYSVVVANHIHILRVERGTQTEVATFSATFPEARIRFGSSQTLPAALSQLWAGLAGILSAAGPILFLAALVLACPKRRELSLCAAALIPGQALGLFGSFWLGWHGSRGRAEALIALASAYLAAEVAARLHSRGRWLLAGALGAIHGPYLVTLCGGTPAFFPFAGAALGQILVIALLASGAGTLRERGIHFFPKAAAATALCGLGTVWFLVRLWV